MKNQNNIDSHEAMIHRIITYKFKENPKSINRITIGICNEVYTVELTNQEVIVRLSPVDKYLMGSHDNIPKFKKLGINVPNILFEDYSKILIPYSYQILTKISGQDLGDVILTLNDDQLKNLAKIVASIFTKVKTIPASNQFGMVWGGGDNELSDSWTERMRIWIDESKERGQKTGVMDSTMLMLAEKIFEIYQAYFNSIKPITYYGDISSKNIMIHEGKFSGLVDLDGLTQGDPLEALGRIYLSWYGTHHGEVYSNAIMSELNLSDKERKLVIMYALLNQISWTCENGIQFNLNTKAVVDRDKEKSDKEKIKILSQKLFT